MYQNILQQNIYSEGLKEKFLIVGSCLESRYPEVVKLFSQDWNNIYSFCLEESHYNQLVAKLSNILALGRTGTVGFLTVDGSPHCVQMHFADKYLKRILKNEQLNFVHYVITETGNVVEVPQQIIDKSKLFADQVSIK